MIDLHCHLLPAIDDGAQSLEETLALARQAVEDGIHTVVATPHFRHPVDFQQQLQARKTALQATREALQRENIPLNLLEGGEITANGHLFREVFPKFPALLLPTPPNSTPTALGELPLDLEVTHAQGLLFEAQLNGFQLLLAHPERYPGFRNNIPLLKSLLDKGILLQFNQESLRTGFFHARHAKPILDLMAYAPQQVFLASDAHHPTFRPCRLSPAKTLVTQTLGENSWSLMTFHNQQKIMGL